MSVDLFRKRLISSGLLPEEDLQIFIDDLPASKRPGDAAGLARALVSSGKLTKYQAKELMGNNAKSLVFGNYVVFDKIGAGGMGIVLKARHQRMDRIVAVKVLPEKMLKSSDAVDRFYREVKAAARLSHSNVVTAFDAGEHDGTHYFVMEYVEGQNLAQLVQRRGPLPVAEAVDYTIQAARGLEYAHNKGIVHRDIKPANLLLDTSGTVKILDLGLARFEHGLDDNEADRLTKSGQVMGTCDYMAPEQAEDTHRADHRADIYSLGCSMYRLLTGRSMYAGETLVQILLAHRDQPIPSLRVSRPDVSAQLDGVYQKMVAKRPEQRYQSMGESIAALEACLHTVPVAADDIPTATYQAGKKSDSDLKTFLKQFSPGGETIRSQVEMDTGGDPPQPSLLPTIPQQVKPWWFSAGIGAGVVLAIGFVTIFLWPKSTPEQVTQTARMPADLSKSVPPEPELLQAGLEPLPVEAAVPAASMESTPESAAPTEPSPQGEAPVEVQPEPPMQPEPPADAGPVQPEPSPQPAPTVDPAEVARRELLEKQRVADANYVNLMKPVEEKVTAWDFTAAWQAAELLKFEESELAARLETRRDEIQRMERLKQRIIAKIREADPPLKKSDLRIRGIGGEITDAGPAGITTKTIKGEVERLAWDNLGSQAAGKLVELVVNPANGEDCIAAGLLAFSMGDRSSAERLFAQAKAAGADVSAQLAATAATMLAEANELLSQNEFGKAASLLESLDARYADLPWLAANRETIDASVAIATKGVREAEAEDLYAEAVAMEKEASLFDLRDVLTQLRTDYADCLPVTDKTRSPAFGQLEEAIADLGQRFIVRLDGQGDYASLQAAIDAAGVNSLIEIQDSGPYNEKIEILEGKAGLTIQGQEGFWPMITSDGPRRDFEILVTVYAPRVSLRRLVVNHSAAASDLSKCMVAGSQADSLALRYCILSGGKWLVFSGDQCPLCSLHTCILAGPSMTYNGTIEARDCQVFGEIEYGDFKLVNCLLTRAIKHALTGELRSCSFAASVKVSGTPGTLADCILPSIEAVKPGIQVDHCCLYGDQPFRDLAKPGVGCFQASPQFVNPDRYDYRLLPTSPCIGKASDGGDIGIRYTPEMIQMLNLALELRAKGVIKF